MQHFSPADEESEEQFVSVTKDKLLKKEGEMEELNKELLSMKGKGP